MGAALQHRGRQQQERQQRQLQDAQPPSLAWDAWAADADDLPALLPWGASPDDVDQLEVGAGAQRHLFLWVLGSSVPLSGACTAPSLALALHC